MIPLANQSYTGEDNYNTRLINCYVEAAPEGAISPFTIEGSAGETLFATLPGECRGLHEMGGVLYGLFGDKFSKISSTGVITEIGTIPGGGMTTMSDNGAQIEIVVPGLATYIATASTVINLGRVFSSVTFLDGRFIFSKVNSGQFEWTAVNDGTTFDPLDFATAESDPDILVRVFEDTGSLVMMGTHTIETFRNVGSTFTRIGGSKRERGLFARDSVQKIDNAIAFLGDNYTVFRMDDFSPVRISTHAVETKIQSYANPETAIGMTWSENGHIFYALKFDEATWVYDAATQRWHERESYQQNTWKMNAVIEIYGKTYGGAQTGNIYEMDMSAYSEAGDLLVMTFDMIPVHAQGNWSFATRLELDMKPGVGLATGQGSDPQVMMKYSDDAGRTWSNELWRSMGKIGEYNVRTVWNRLGRFRTRIHRFSVSDPVPRVGIFVNMEAQIGSR